MSQKEAASPTFEQAAGLLSESIKVTHKEKRGEGAVILRFLARRCDNISRLGVDIGADCPNK